MDERRFASVQRSQPNRGFPEGWIQTGTAGTQRTARQLDGTLPFSPVTGRKGKKKTVKEGMPGANGRRHRAGGTNKADIIPHPGQSEHAVWVARGEVIVSSGDNNAPTGTGQRPERKGRGWDVERVSDIPCRAWTSQGQAFHTPNGRSMNNPCDAWKRKDNRT